MVNVEKVEEEDIVHIVNFNFPMTKVSTQLTERQIKDIIKKYMQQINDSFYTDWTELTSEFNYPNQ